MSDGTASILAAIQGVAERLGAVEHRLQTIEHGMQTIGQRLQTIEQGMLTIEQRLQTVEQGILTIDQRLQTVEQGMLTVGQRLQTLEVGVQALELGQQNLAEAVQQGHRDLITTRADLMERMDRLQDKLSMMRDDVVVNYGSIDRVEGIAKNGIDQVRLLSEQFSMVMKRVLGLDQRVNALEDKDYKRSAA